MAVYTGKLPKLGTTNYENVYVPPYANQDAQLPPSMQDAIEQAKVNLGYAKPAQPSGMPSSVYEQLNASQISKYPTPTASASTPTNAAQAQLVISKTGNMSTKPDGMPTSDYNKYLEAQGGNKMPSVGVGALVSSQVGALPGSIVGSSGSNTSSASGGNGGSNAAQSRYNNSINALQDAYSQRLASLQGNLASQQNLLKANLGASRDVLAQDAERALQEAYINRMMNERALQQQLNAQGLSGGATESAMSSLLNNYGTSRNNINVAYNNNLAELEQAYLANLAQAQQNYNDAVAKAASDNANYKMELENALYKAMLA
jgi:hypothetical protein